MKTIFSNNLHDYIPIIATNYEHFSGDFVVFNKILTAIGGKTTRKLEVLQGQQWNDKQIPEVGNSGGSITHFTSLVVQTTLYVFGIIFLNSNGKYIYLRRWSECLEIHGE